MTGGNWNSEPWSWCGGRAGVQRWYWLFLCNKLTKAELLHQKSFIISQFLGVRNPGVAQPGALGWRPFMGPVVGTTATGQGCPLIWRLSWWRTQFWVTDRSQFLTGCWLEPSPQSLSISTGQLASHTVGKVGEGACHFGHLLFSRITSGSPAHTQGHE